jgi:predicted  nucleic acid-binding Zn-ribbon protein
VVKFAEFYEKELFKYPKQRVWALERQLENEKKRRKEIEHEVSDLKQTLKNATNLNQEVTQIYLKTQVMAQDIQDQLVPQTKALMNLKTHVASLYQQLGNTELKSWYHTLIEAGEFE